MFARVMAAGNVPRATAALAASSGFAAPRAALTVRSLPVQRADSGRAAPRVARIAVGGDGSGLF